MSFKTAVGHLAIIGGGYVEQPDNMLADERTALFSRGRKRGSLYVLVEVSGRPAGRDEVAASLCRIVHTGYYEFQGSVTAGLQQAVRSANAWLFEENRNSLPGERRSAGISCLVLRDDDLFVAQAGPAAAFLAQAGDEALPVKGRINRFPEVSPWLDDVSPDDLDAAPMGARRDVDVALFHAQVRREDRVLLVDTGLVGRLSPQIWQEILNASSVDDFLDTLEAAGGGRDLSALVVWIGLETEAEGAIPHPRPGETEPASAAAGPEAWRLREGWVEQARRVIELGLAALGVVGAALLSLLKRLIPGPVSPQPQAERRADASEAPIGGRRPAAPAATAAPTPRADTPQPALGQPAPAATSAKKESRPRKGRTPSNRAQKLLAAVAIAIPLVVAVIVLTVYVQRGQTQKAELELLMQKANASWSLAQESTDRAAIRGFLVEAQQQLDQLLARQPDRADALELQRNIRIWLDDIGRVQRISWIADLRTYPDDSDLTRVVVEGVHVFVMDRNAGLVYHHQLDELQQALQPATVDTVLVKRGNQVGDVLVGDLVDMVWISVGMGRQKANLGILESNGALLEYDPTTGELLAYRVAASGTWQFPKLVGTYFGRFYVLDSTANKIWRYQPTVDGYSEPPDDWLEAEVDLLGVEDMAIGDSIYLAYNDGRILKMTAGEPDTFDLSDWDVPPSRPTALFTRPPDDTQSVYVADAGNDRIVQCSVEGRFERQFRLADTAPQASDGETGQGAAPEAGGEATDRGDGLAGVTSLFIDEIGGRAFFLSGPKLYMIILPE